MTILPLKILFCVNFMFSKGLQNYANPQHNFLHMGSTPPLYTMCKKTSDLVEDGFPYLETKRAIRDPLNEKLPFFRAFQIFENNLDFLILWFLDRVAISQKWKELQEICWRKNERNFISFSDFSKQIGFMDFWISIFQDFWIKWWYLWNKKLPEIC